MDLFQHTELEHGFGQQLLQLAVFLFQLFQAFGIGQIHIDVFTLPAVEGGFGDVMLATDGVDRLVFFSLP